MSIVQKTFEHVLNWNCFARKMLGLMQKINKGYTIIYDSPF